MNIKLLTVASLLIVGGVSPLQVSAQVNEDEFEALLNQSRTQVEGQPSQVDESSIQVVDLNPALMYEEIDSNRAEIDTLQSQIKLLQARKELFTLQQELKLLESGQDGSTFMPASPGGMPNVIDSTNRVQPQQAEENNRVDAHIAALQETIESLEAKVTNRVDEFQQALDQSINTREPTLQPVSMRAPDLNDETRWSVLSTTINEDGGQAEVVNDLGSTFQVKAGDKMGPLTVQEVRHGLVRTRGDDGKSYTLEPRNLAYMQPLPYQPQAIALGTDVTSAEYPPFNDSTRTE